VKPYVSIVMGIGGNLTDDLLSRLKTSTLQNSRLANKYGLEAEIVIVEWNLALKSFGAAELAVRGAQLPVRIIHTPRELHAQVPNPHGFRYFEWYPKNIGIRRARGQFVLSTNPDDLWQEGLAQYLAKRELRVGHFYRVDRHDFRDGNVFRICYPTGAKPPGLKPEEIRKNAPLACPWSENMLHYNAAGDFTLMSYDDWRFIHGNPEREYNDSVDGQTLWLAHTKGLKQIVLPYPILHPDHERTLNVAEASGRIMAGLWDDNKPFTRENSETWGFADLEFEETVL